MSASIARRKALEVLGKVRARDAWAHETLDSTLAASPELERRDRALATRLAYGTIATSGTLDEALDRFLSRPGRLEPRIRDALRIAAWELLFGGVEPHVAVNEGVELVRGLRANATGLANAVLRQLAEATPTFPWGDPDVDTAALARLWGHPVWLTELLIADLGRAAAEAVLAADNTPAPTYLALLAPQADRDTIVEELEGAGAEPAPGPLSGSVRIERPAALRSARLLASGAAEICDAGAQFAAHAVRPCPEARIVDIGAGRGNKTLLLEALAREAGGWADLVAVDSQAFKLDVLQRRASLSRLDGISTILADATALPGRTGLREGEADAVLLDAPCSGLGTLRRHPDKRWRLVPEDIERLAALDERLLRSASRLVRRGGFMVYSTCTLTKRENADVVSAFLGSSAGEGFSVDDLSSEVPETWLRFLGPEGWFQSIPEIDGFDGHFVARLRRG